MSFTTASGTYQYDEWCPCFDGSGLGNRGGGLNTGVNIVPLPATVNAGGGGSTTPATRAADAPKPPLSTKPSLASKRFNRLPALAPGTCVRTYFSSKRSPVANMECHPDKQYMACRIDYVPRIPGVNNAAQHETLKHSMSNNNHLFEKYRYKFRYTAKRTD